jgi:uncharacterized protein (DUF1778 family)
MPVKKRASVKSERILIRLTESDKEIVQKAADINERKLADWARLIIVTQSRRAVENEAA